MMTDGGDNVPSLPDPENASPPLSALHPLADELMGIAARLRDTAAGEAGLASPREPSIVHDRLALARRTYALRRKRSAIFGNAELFGEPAWDIMLDLFIAHCDGKPVSVSSACIGSAAPPTTGLRWLGILGDEGLIEREADAADQRRVMVRLSAKGIAAMERFFDAVRDGA